MPTYYSILKRARNSQLRLKIGPITTWNLAIICKLPHYDMAAVPLATISKTPGSCMLYIMLNNFICALLKVELLLDMRFCSI